MMATPDAVKMLDSGDVIWTCARFKVNELPFDEFMKFELICDIYKTCAECLKDIDLIPKEKTNDRGCETPNNSRKATRNGSKDNRNHGQPEISPNRHATGRKLGGDEATKGS